METVLAGFVIIFVIIFAVLSLSNGFLTTQDVLRESWQEMDARLDERSHTDLLMLEAHTANTGSIIEFTVENRGALPLADFDHWDVIAEYYDAGDPAGYHIMHLPYSTQALTSNTWTVEGMYMDATEETPEVYEPGILNPGEQIVLQAALTKRVGAGAAVRLILSTENGVSASTTFAGNISPVLTTNPGVTVTTGGTVVMDNTILAITDEDDTPEHLTYTVLAAPTQGDLSLETTFTQEDIDTGQVMYTHTGDSPDSFQLSVSDGKDTTGIYTVDIATSVPPVLVANSGLTITSGDTVTIDSTNLHVTDSDDLPVDLVFTITHAPVQGNLSQETTFTQEDINSRLLMYTHTGVGSDSFQFTVSDGEAVIGAFNFNMYVTN